MTQHRKGFWGRIPKTYRGCRTFSDFLKAYASVFSEANHRRGQGDQRNRAHAALEQQLAPAGRADGAENALVLQGRNVA